MPFAILALTIAFLMLHPMEFVIFGHQVYAGRDVNDGRPPPGLYMWSSGSWSGFTIGTGVHGFAVNWSD